MSTPNLQLRAGARPDLGLLLVLVATAVLYVPALFGQFVGLDDPAYVTANPDVRQPEVLHIFDPRTLTAADWTPMVTVSHAFEYQLFGFDPLPYHAVNVLLHLACTAMVYFLLLDVGIGVEVALLASLLFAVHPFQVESVAWVSSRKNLLAALFGLGFCRAFLAGRVASATLLLALALASKGTAVVFPLWAAVAVACGFGALGRRRAAPWLLFFGLLAVSRGLLSMTAQSAVIAARAVGGMSFSQRMTITSRVLATQARQFFLPYDLCMDYFWSPSTWGDPHVLLSWAAVAAVVGGVAWAARRDLRVAIGGSFAVLALLPALSIIPAPQFQADRYAHLALIGAGVLVVLLVRPLGRINRWLPEAILLLWIALVLVPTTRTRIAVWRNSETMWQDVLRRDPAFAFGWDNLAMYYLEKGDIEKAEPALRSALQSEPDLERPRLNLALLLANRGAAAESIANLRLLLAKHPASAAGQELIGRLLSDQGADDEAMAHLDAAVRLDAGAARARYDRARLLARVGRLDDAARDYEELLRERRAGVLLKGLASVRLQQQQIESAIALAREATERTAEDAEAWGLLGRGLVAAGDLEAAESSLVRALAANPGNADLWYQLAALRRDRGEREGSRAAAEQALQQAGSAQPQWLESARELAK